MKKSRKKRKIDTRLVTKSRCPCTLSKYYKYQKLKYCTFQLMGMKSSVFARNGPYATLNTACGIDTIESKTETIQDVVDIRPTDFAKRKHDRNRIFTTHNHTEPFQQ